MVLPIIPILAAVAIGGSIGLGSVGYSRYKYSKECHLGFDKDEHDSRYFQVTLEKCDQVDVDAALFERFKLTPIVDTTTKYVIVTNRNVVLKRDAFANVKDTLISLAIIYNQEVQFENGAFNGLNMLKSLDLTTNNIKQIPEGLFANLPSLTQLRLPGNMLRTLNGNDFKQLENIRYLDFSNNDIETVTGEMNNQLIDIYLSNNKLANLKPADLAGFNLHSLAIQGNNIPDDMYTEILESI